MVSLLAFAGLFAISMATHAHPDHGGEEAHDHEHPADKRAEPTEAQKTKRLERVLRQAEARDRNKVQRTKDRRRHLAKRLARHLMGAPVTPELVKELRAHAERTALLRQIRLVAAQENDYDSVVTADRVLAHENTRHERWWRTVLRQARHKQ